MRSLPLGRMIPIPSYFFELIMPKIGGFVFSGVERQRGQYRFTVKDLEGETFWLVGELIGDPLQIVGPNGNDLQIGFSLRPGTTIAEANAVAKFMNEWIVDIVLF